jgi:hypothetical protein
MLSWCDVCWHPNKNQPWTSWKQLSSFDGTVINAQSGLAECLFSGATVEKPQPPYPALQYSNILGHGMKSAEKWTNFF